MTGSALDELEDRTQKPSQGGDWADWWSPHKDDPDRMVGIVVEAHDTVFEEGDEPQPVFTVRSIGEPSGFDKGVERSTRTHVQLVQGMEQNDVQLGDLVNISYTGLQATDSGNAANTYEIGVVKQDEWEDMDEADLFQEVIDDGGFKTDTRGEGVEGQGNGDGSQSALEESMPDSADDSEFDEEVLEFVQGVIDMQNGEFEVEKLDKMCNEVRDFGIDVEAVAEDLGYEVEDGTVKSS